MNNKSLSALVDQVRGVSYKPKDIHDTLNDLSIVLLRANNIFDGSVDFSDVIYIDRKRVSPSQILRRGDILVCASSGSKDLVGKAASFNCDGEYTFGAFCKVVRPKNIDDADYISVFFQSPKYRREIAASALGANINNIRNEHIDNLVINWPVKLNRDIIVSLLNQSKSIITLRKKQLQLFDELIKARFVEMFGGKKRYMIMQDFCSIITDGTHQPPKFAPEGIPFIFVSNIVEDKVTYNTTKFIDQNTYDELIKRTPIEIGDILLSTVGSYGHPAVVKTEKKFLFQRHIAYLKPRKDIINSTYLHSAILSQDAQRQIEESVKGIAQKTLNLSEIKKMRIPVPCLQEQNDFSTFVTQIDKSKVMKRLRLSTNSFC